MSGVRTVLFDLDGTLADTAPDLAAALDALCREEGREPLPYPRVRNQVSHGTMALLRLAFPEIDTAPDLFERLRARYLDIYSNNRHLDTVLFPGIPAILAYLEKQGFRWGIVTNKPAFLTDPLMNTLGLSTRAACIVSGDTTDRSKPHPKPMLHAAELARTPPEDCLYVGDAARDVEAGRAAGMRTLVALYGYIDETERPTEWGADGLIRDPREILDWILEADPSLRRHG
ncbi:MAG: HAD-IA family hydrolase [Chromatiales bacterium]|nr:HAD-IA family hydrolase [Chromatiales bacterium]